MTVPALTNDTVEFTPEQNLVLGRLAQRMRAVGIALMVLAVLLALRAALGADALGMLAIQAGIVLGFTGFWSVRAAAELSQVATTEGADLSHLMNALGEIRKLYELHFWIFLAAALLMGVTVLIAMTGSPWLPAAW